MLDYRSFSFPQIEEKQGHGKNSDVRLVLGNETRSGTEICSFGPDQTGVSLFQGKFISFLTSIYF